MKKDYLNIDLVLNASEKVVSMYTAMQMMMRKVYISCVWRKVDYAKHHPREPILETANLPFHEKYCLRKDVTRYTCKYGFVEYDQVPKKALERVWWYAENDSRTVLRYLNKHQLLNSEGTDKDAIYKLLSDPTFKRIYRLLYNVNIPVIVVRASMGIIKQALYGTGRRPLGTFRLPVTKWDIPIEPDSLEYLREHFPELTCKIENVFLYIGVNDAGKRALCVRLRCVNTFDPENVSTVGELVYRDPYVITHPDKPTFDKRYPMLVKENNYKFEKSYDYYHSEIMREACKLLDLEIPPETPPSPEIWLKAADNCAKRYQERRKEKKVPSREVEDIVTTTTDASVAVFQ